MGGLQRAASPFRGTNMKLTITKDCEWRGRKFTQGQTLLMSGQGANDLLNAGWAICDDGRCGQCQTCEHSETASMKPAAERATTKKPTRKKKPAKDDA